MEILLSGFLGAVIATLLSIAYLHDSNKIRERREVFLEVVSYFDDMYQLLQKLQIYKEIENTSHGKLPFNQDEYRIVSDELTRLLISTRIHARLSLSFGNGQELSLLNELSSCLSKAASLIRRSTRSGWVIEGPELHTLFAEEIDPLRNKLHEKLLAGTKYWPTIHKFSGKKSHNE